MKISNEALVERSTLMVELDALNNEKGTKANNEAFRKKWLRLVELNGFDEKACRYIADGTKFQSYDPLFAYLLSVADKDDSDYQSVLAKSSIFDGGDERQAKLLFSLFALAISQGDHCASIVRWIVETITKSSYVRSYSPAKLGDSIRTGVAKALRKGDDKRVAGGAALLPANVVDDFKAVLSPALNSLENDGKNQNTARVLAVLTSWFGSSASEQNNCKIDERPNVEHDEHPNVEREKSEARAASAEPEQEADRPEPQLADQTVEIDKQNNDAEKAAGGESVDATPGAEETVVSHVERAADAGGRDSFESALQNLADLYHEHDARLNEAVQENSSLGAKLEELTNNTEMLSDELRGKNNELQEAFAALSQKEDMIRSLEAARDEAQRQCDDLETQCADFEGRLAEASSLAGDLKSRLAAATKQLQEQTERNETLDREKDELNARIKDMAAQIESNEQMIEILDDAAKKHGSEEMVRLASDLRPYYGEYKICLGDEMNIDLGENLRDQLGEVFKTLKKFGVEL